MEIDLESLEAKCMVIRILETNWSRRSRGNARLSGLQARSLQQQKPRALPSGQRRETVLENTHKYAGF
jgi:hypothetical protein